MADSSRFSALIAAPSWTLTTALDSILLYINPILASWSPAFDSHISSLPETAFSSTLSLASSIEPDFILIPLSTLTIAWAASTSVRMLSILAAAPTGNLSLFDGSQLKIAEELVSREIFFPLRTAHSIFISAPASTTPLSENTSFS